MPYVTAIFDRTQADIITQTAKAFLNVADWVRIYDNSEIVNGLFTSAIGYPLDFDALTDPTTVSIPTTTELNILLVNIERMRYWAYVYLGGYIFPDADFVEIKDDWDDGYQAAAPNFSHVNSWEYVIDVLYNLLSTWTPPTITGDLGLFGGGSLALFGAGNLALFG